MTRQLKKKNRTLRFGSLLFLISITALGAYTIQQYEKGRDTLRTNSIEVEQFEGDVVLPTNPGVENILFLGIEKRKKQIDRPAVIFVLSWDRTNETIRLLSFMKNIEATVPGYETSSLQSAYTIGGAQAVKDTLTGMFNLPIHHYVLAYTNDFERLIDIAFPNGVSMTEKKEMTTLPAALAKDVWHGREIIQYARHYEEEDGEFGRIDRQQQIVRAMREEASDWKMILQLPKTLGALSELVATDIPSKSQLSKIVAFLLQKHETIETLRIPIEGTYQRNEQTNEKVLQIDTSTNRQTIEQFLQQE